MTVRPDIKARVDEAVDRWRARLAAKAEAGKQRTLAILASEAAPGAPVRALAGVASPPAAKRAKAPRRPVVASPRPDPPEGSIGWQIQCRTPNTKNGNGQGARRWDAPRKAKLRELARDVALAAFVLAGLRWGELTPCVILLRRVAPSEGLDEHDGLPVSLAPVVDGVFDALGLKNDRTPLVDIVYRQRRGAQGEHAVDIEWRRK